MMTDQAEPVFYLPLKMGRIVLQALEEVIGQNGVNAILNQAGLSHLIENYPPNSLDRQFRFTDLSAIQLALEQIYGSRGGRGVALRSGRVCFKYGLREFFPEPGPHHNEFRLAPIETKINHGAQILADLFNQSSDQRVTIESTPENILWKIERCPLCWGRHTDSPACHLMVGVLQEGLYWISGGKFFNVEEISCAAQGHSICTILIDKHMLE